MQGHFLAQCTKPAIVGIVTMVPSRVRAGRPRSRVGRPDGGMEGIRGANSLNADGRLFGKLPFVREPGPRHTGRIIQE